ncbi:hypothetical protein ACQPZP_28640 [Spirillospora sp. CA-142024]|uniref:hypothetical protein n=1 Tax=Spirillospora sp. CA-142024 TaxID=3240036 RepID=UPI003D8A55A4
MPNIKPARKRSWLAIAVLAILVGAIAASISIRPHGEQPGPFPPAITKPPSSNTSGAGEPSSAAPTTEPAATSPTPSATGTSDPADDGGIVVAKFDDKAEGPYLVLAPADADPASLEKLVLNDSLRDLGKVQTWLPYHDKLWKVSVSQDVYNNCQAFKSKADFAERAQQQTYPTCADTSKSTTR